jgi:hypothetical protein
VKVIDLTMIYLKERVPVLAHLPPSTVNASPVVLLHECKYRDILYQIIFIS